MNTLITHLIFWDTGLSAPGEQLGVWCLAQGSHLSRGLYRQALAVAAWHVWCRHDVTHLSRRNKATSASDRRPSAPWILSIAGKLIRSDIYTCPTSSLIVPQAFSSFVFYLPSLSFCHSARLFTERSLLHIMSRHAPYCWLATSLFWYSALTPFSKTFLKNCLPCL